MCPGAFPLPLRESWAGVLRRVLEWAGADLGHLSRDILELRILGAHNMESRETRLESHLIDGVLVLDAGGLTRSLTFDEQRGIRAILLSHRHFDHVRDLLPLGLNMAKAGATVEVYAIEDTIHFVKSKLLDGSIYPDFLKFPSPESPAFHLNVVEFYKEFQVMDYTAVAVPVPHAVPAAGFQITLGGVRLFYTGDTGRGIGEFWDHVSPEVLLTEVTFGNENQARAIEVGHLTPAFLSEALASFSQRHGFLPKVIVSHMNPPWESAVRRELDALSREIGVEILVSHADMTLDL